jgi:ribosome-binding ATPase YchF (GTP1/OBG family)
MEVGIMGLTASGKSTVFGLLTGQSTDLTGTRHGSVQIGIARVPDPRLDALSAMYEPDKTTPASVRYVDVPGIPEEHRQDAAFNLPELRAVDALMVVLRAFENDTVAHPLGSVDPLRDLRHIEEEFILQDLMVVEKRLERLHRDLAKRKVPELEGEQVVLERCQSVLENNTPLRAQDFNDEDEKILRGFTFLSLKPMLVVLNVGDDQLSDELMPKTGWSDWKTRPQMAFTRRPRPRDPRVLPPPRFDLVLHSRQRRMPRLVDSHRDTRGRCGWRDSLRHPARLYSCRGGAS